MNKAFEIVQWLIYIVVLYSAALTIQKGVSIESFQF